MGASTQEWLALGIVLLIAGVALYRRVRKARRPAAGACNGCSARSGCARKPGV